MACSCCFGMGRGTGVAKASFATVKVGNEAFATPLSWVTPGLKGQTVWVGVVVSGVSG